MEKIWLNHYPPSIPAEIALSASDSVRDLFLHACDKYADKPAISNYGVVLTYRQVEQLSRDFAAYLQQDCGLQKGDRVAIMLPNVLQYHVTMFGILRAGLVVVNVNPLYTADELVHQLSDAGATTLVVLANFAAVVEQALPRMPLMKYVIVTEMGDLFGFFKKTLMNFVVRRVKKMVPNYQLPHAIRFSDALRLGKAVNYQTVPLAAHDIACLQYTGGTTGVPKAAILSHGNLVANARQAGAWVKACDLHKGGETALVPLPLYHIFSMTVCGLALFKLGICVELVTNPRDIAGLLKVMQKTPFSIFLGINTLFNALLHQKALDNVDFSKLRLVVAGGMALQQKTAEGWYERTGVKILEGYGLTEASPVVAINLPDQAIFTGAVGVPVPSTEIAFKNDAGEDMPLGESGELCVRGPQIMQGYWHKEAETAQVFTQDGYLRTGDIGYLDKDGRVYLIDRKKDMILVSGFNVYPAEVESVLVSHPGIREAGVVGVPSEQTGEMVRAFIVREDPTLTVDQVIAYCHEHLTRYKVPKSIMFVEDLPKSNIGKVLRRKLREI